jgi:hypothetical protein
LIYASAHVANDFANIKYDSAFVTGADIDKHLQDALTFAKPLIISVRLATWTYTQKDLSLDLVDSFFFPMLLPLWIFLTFNSPAHHPEPVDNLRRPGSRGCSRGLPEECDAESDSPGSSGERAMGNHQ